MFNPWAQLMMAVFACSGMLLAYLEAPQRGDWWVQGIKLYMLPTCVWAMIGAAEFSWVPYPDGCITSKCQMAAAPGRLTMTYIRMGGVLAMGLIYLGLMTFLRRHWNDLLARRKWALENVHNPEKWYVNPDTGESFKIKKRHRGYVRFSTETYATRVMKEADAILEYNVARGITWACWFAFVGMLAYTAQNDSFWTEAGSWLAFGLAVLATLMMMGAAGVRIKAGQDVGPPTVAPREDTSVEDQRVHDTGGLMDDDELDAALKGEIRTSKPIRSQPRRA